MVLNHPDISGPMLNEMNHLELECHEIYLRTEREGDFIP